MGRRAEIEDLDEAELADLIEESGNARDQGSPTVGHNSGREEEDALYNLGLDDLAREGQRYLMIDLVRNIKHGTASYQEKAIFAKLLKDNGYIFGNIEEGSRSGRKEEAPDLPEFGRPDYA